MRPLAFSDFTWDPARRLLSRDGAPVRLGARAADILALLLLHRDRLVGKSEILEQVWPAATVEENNLTVQVSALRKLLGRGVISTVAGRGYRWAVPVSEAPEPIAAVAGASAARKPAVCVLPFEVRPARTAAEGAEDSARHGWAGYLGDGLARDVAAGLSKSPWLVVIAHDSAQAFRGTGLALGEIASRLGAQYLVRGTVSRRSGRLRVTAELLFGPTGEILMAEAFERPAGDLFELEDLVVRRVVGALEPRVLQAEELRARWRPSGDVSQWDLLMRARWHFARASAVA
ncbi:MAG: winged helix-turn-helix domain-containing protein [Rubrivivax sp.]